MRSDVVVSCRCRPIFRTAQSRELVGVDPDVCVITPPPPGAGERPVTSIRTWVEGNAPPLLAIEVVSETNPHKDYSIGPDKYAASGTQELVVFDPLLCGPDTHGGPFRLQVWKRAPDGTFARNYVGDGPAWLWLTIAEAERAAKEAALARIVELEAELARRR